MPRAQIKDEKTYQKLLEKGESKEKSARIANAAAGSSRRKVGAKGGKSPSYDDWAKADLVKRTHHERDGSRVTVCEGPSPLHESPAFWPLGVSGKDLSTRPPRRRTRRR